MTLKHILAGLVAIALGAVALQGFAETKETAVSSQPTWSPGTFTRPADSVLQETLTPLQYRVTRHNATERPFVNEYVTNHEEGIYVDVISGEPLFASTDKYDSGSGWPSFTRPLVPEQVVEVTDASHGMVRTEVRSKLADSHLGHVFDDGPAPTGQRYCVNSASLRFVPRDQMEAQGYGDLLPLLDRAD